MQNRRGFTLVELSVVITLVAIISLAVVSFSIFMNQKAVASRKTIAAMQELDIAESMIESWLDRNGGASIGDDLDLDTDHKLLYNGESLQLSGGRLLLNDSALTFDSLKSATFTKNTSGGKLILYCNMTYSTGQGEKTICVVICPRVEALEVTP